MKILLRDSEIAEFLASTIDYKKIAKDIEMNETETGYVICYILEEKQKRKYNLEKMREKFKSRIDSAVRGDLKTYVEKIKYLISNKKKEHRALISEHIEYFIDKLGEENVIEMYKTSNFTSFVKGAGNFIDPDAEFVRRKRFSDIKEDCFFRNMEGNENLILDKINHNYPFWFIDTGYTNFLETNKKWHRLVRNNLHHVKIFEPHVDRLGIFKSFPQPWRSDGDRILVIEPGSFSAKTFGVDINKWKYDVEKEIRKYSNKKIVFREKQPKKIRTSLYQHLLEEDYHCVININSNAAIESIWAGIPVITLGDHISNSVSSKNISDLTSLNKPNLSAWLSMLSYSQFTYEEIINGTAVKAIKKFYE